MSISKVRLDLTVRIRVRKTKIRPTLVVLLSRRVLC